MKKIIFFIILYVMIFGVIVADEPPLPMTEFTSQNNEYKLILVETIREANNLTQKWKLVRIDTNEVLYDFIYPQFALSGLKVLISDDGNNIVLIDWFLWVDWNNEDTQTIMNKNIVKFYYMGEETRRYKLSALFNSIENGIKSVSHLQWTRDNRNYIIMENDQVKIRTLESIEYVFNIRTGDIESRLEYR